MWVGTGHWVTFSIRVNRQAREGGNLLEAGGPITAQQISLNLKQYALEAEEQTDFSMRSFRSEGAVSRALADSLLSRNHLEEPKHSVEVHEAHGGSLTGSGRKLYGRGNYSESVQKN